MTSSQLLWLTLWPGPVAAKESVLEWLEACPEGVILERGGLEMALGGPSELAVCGSRDKQGRQWCLGKLKRALTSEALVKRWGSDNVRPRPGLEDLHALAVATLGAWGSGDGVLQIAVAYNVGAVELHFSHPIADLKLDPQSADNLAMALRAGIHEAQKLEERN